MINLKNKKTLRVFSILATSILALSLSTTASSAEDTYIEATETTWGIISTDDGFDKTLTIYKDGDNQGYSDMGTSLTYTIEIQCSKRKLSVLVYSDPIGIFPTSSMFGSAYALVKIDSGKVSKFAYTEMKDSSGIGINSDKALTTAMLKGKNTVAFKIPSSIQADTVATFTLGDLSKYVNRFKGLGCALK